MYLQKYEFKNLRSLYLIADDNYLYRISWKKPKGEFKKKETPVHKKAFKQLKEYFSQKRKKFDLPLKFESGTEFQKKVWKSLAKIPYGKVVSYSDIAKKVNSPKAVRAVGAANGKNPIPIVLPCHRVIGKNGKLVGFASGLKTKRALLDLEKAF